MDDQCWGEKLSKLDFERECSAPTSVDCCWLCDDLEKWNAVLNPIELNLTEWQVGKLQLCTLSGLSASDVEEWDTPYGAHFFLVWLPKKHSCVQAVSLAEGHPYLHTTEAPDNIAQCASNLHHISIVGDMCFDWSLVLDGLCPVQQLEVLELRNVRVSDSLAATLAHILSTNAISIKRVSLSQSTIHCSASSILLSGISKCENLKELIFSANLNPAGLRQFIKILRSTRTLETLHLEELENDDCSMESNAEKNNKKIRRAIGYILRENMSLTELRYEACGSGCTEFLSALETNTVLKSLTISSCNRNCVYIGRHVGAVLKLVLSKNQGLHSLTFEGCDIDHSAAELISQGLQQNTTLQVLDVSESYVGPRVQDLLSALGQNRTLRLLKIDAAEMSPRMREALSMELTRNQWYGRVLVPCIDTDVEGLIASMSDLLLCPIELCLDTNLLSEASFFALCNVLASNTCVKELTLYLQSVTPAYVTSLHQMLEENTSLRSLTLYDGYAQPGLSVVLSQGLIGNEFVTDLTLVCYEINTMSAELLRLLLEANESLHKLVLSSRCGLEPRCLDTISEGLIQNNFITEIDVESVTLTMRKAVQRNVTCLHRAVRFVLRQNVEKLFAEAFELLESKASLISCLKSTSGMTEAEANAAVKAARKFIYSNYLFINRIVSRKLECYAGKNTQIDKLNFECWLAITKYLNISDVVNT